MIKTNNTIYLGTAIPAGAENGLDIIIKSKTIPNATSDTFGQIRIYAGETNETYTHGYIYECKANDPEYEAIFYFDPIKVANVTYDKAAEFLQEATNDFKQIVSGSMKYLKAGDLWDFTFKDSAGNIVLDNYKLYTEDIADFGFVMVYPIEDFEDNEVINFEIVLRELSNSFYWERIDVQP